MSDPSEVAGVALAAAASVAAAAASAAAAAASAASQQGTKRSAAESIDDESSKRPALEYGPSLARTAAEPEARICFPFLNHGACSRGNMCRFRHLAQDRTRAHPA